MINQNFTIINGGLSREAMSCYRFAYAEITNTRLMGVLGLHIKWELEGSPIHQYIYYDVEELGIDYIKSSMDDDLVSVDMTMRSCFGGLGGDMVPLTEKEAMYLANFFIEDTLKKEEKLPVSIKDLSFITDRKPEMSEAEISSILQKICVPIKTDFGLVNYYLMRLFGKDPKAAELLSCPDAPKDNFEEIAPELHSTFLKNSVQRFTNQDGSISYLSESLIENSEGHSLVFSEILLKDNKVFSAKKKSSMHITENEASLKLARDEYILLFEVDSDIDDFDDDLNFFALGATMSDYDFGRMLMEFKAGNDHVEKPQFNLNDDVDAVYFLTDSNQLLIALYTLQDVPKMEARINSSIIGSCMDLVQRYHFDNSILFDFAISGFDDFTEFIEELDQY